MPRIDLGQAMQWISWSAVVLQFLTAAMTAGSALGRRRCCSGGVSQHAVHPVPRRLHYRRCLAGEHVQSGQQATAAPQPAMTRSAAWVPLFCKPTFCRASAAQAFPAVGPVRERLQHVTERA